MKSTPKNIIHDINNINRTYSVYTFGENVLRKYLYVIFLLITDTLISLLSLDNNDHCIHTTVSHLFGNKSLIQEFIFKKLTAGEIAQLSLGITDQLKTRIRFTNPFITALTIHDLNLKIDYGEKMNADYQFGFIRNQTHIRISPRQELITSYVDLAISAKLNTRVAMLASFLKGTARFSLQGSMNFTFGNSLCLKQWNGTMLNITAQQEPTSEIVSVSS